MLLPQVLAFATLATAISISPLYRGTNAERLSRGLKPLRPARPFGSRDGAVRGTRVAARQAAQAEPSAGLFLSPHDIQGKSYLSPYDGKSVDGLRGVVTAVG